jgi:hypothetical protein
MKTFLNLSFLLPLFVAAKMEAQSYNSAMGARLGAGTTATYKKFISTKGAIEAYAGLTGYSGIDLGAGLLYQHHLPFSSVEGLQGYFGGGVTARSWGYLGVYGGLWAGPQGCAGLEYKFKDLPVTISVDWLPTFWVVVPQWYRDYYNIFGYSSYSPFSSKGGGLTIRYVLK